MGTQRSHKVDSPASSSGEGNNRGARSILFRIEIVGFSLPRKVAHLSDGEAVAKMGHPGLADAAIK